MIKLHSTIIYIYGGWKFPDCWKLRQYIYFDKYKSLFSNKVILDLGSNFSFYSVFAIDSGSSKVIAVEGDLKRHSLAKSFVKICNLEDRVICVNDNIENFIDSFDFTKEKIDIVLFLDVFYYLDNGIPLFSKIKNKINLEYIMFESTVVSDIENLSSMNQGHCELWYAKTESSLFQSYTNDKDQELERLALTPSRKFLKNVIDFLGFEKICYYDYQNFIGRGESPTRSRGEKDFYLLKNKNAK